MSHQPSDILWNKPGTSQQSKHQILTFVTPQLNIKKGEAYRCMFCTLVIKDVPMGCPIKMRQRIVKKNPIEFDTVGMFCSFNCAQAHVNKNTHDGIFADSTKLLTMMMSLNRDGKISLCDLIVPSPEINLMTAYGGNLTEKQYQAAIGKIIYKNEGFTRMIPQTTIYTTTELV